MFLSKRLKKKEQGKIEWWQTLHPYVQTLHPCILILPCLKWWQTLHPCISWDRPSTCMYWPSRAYSGDRPSTRHANTDGASIHRPDRQPLPITSTVCRTNLAFNGKVALLSCTYLTVKFNIDNATHVHVCYNYDHAFFADSPIDNHNCVRWICRSYNYSDTTGSSDSSYSITLLQNKLQICSLKDRVDLLEEKVQKQQEMLYGLLQPVHPQPTYRRYHHVHVHETPNHFTHQSSVDWARPLSRCL